MRRIRDLALLACVAFLAGAAAVLSLSARALLSDQWYKSHRYEEIGGAFTGLFDAVFAFACGALLGVGIAVRLGAFGKGSPARWPWYLDVLPAAVLIYLVVAANFG
jgi:hypothetical protein